MRSSLERRWYRSSHDVVTFLLLPLSWVFRSVVSLRRFFYRYQIKKSFTPRVPVIIAGNITVGGTGKTPLVIWLAHFLQQNGFKPGIVSRGVGGVVHRTPCWVRADSDPSSVGDEGVLLSRLSECPVVVGVNRVAAVKELLAKTDCNIVISDDGLQHYRLGRHIEIALLDGERGVGNGSLLPAGPLRESVKRLSEVDFVIKQVSASRVDSLDKMARAFKSDKISLFEMQLQGNNLIGLLDNKRKIVLADLQGQKVHGVAGIGNPYRFFATLRRFGLEVIEHVFPDHYLYQASDLKFNDDLPVIMTEKDAVKCVGFAGDNWWCLPVRAEINGAFGKDLLEKIGGLN